MLNMLNSFPTSPKKCYIKNVWRQPDRTKMIHFHSWSELFSPLSQYFSHLRITSSTWKKNFKYLTLPFSGKVTSAGWSFSSFCKIFSSALMLVTKRRRAPRTRYFRETILLHGAIPEWTRLFCRPRFKGPTFMVKLSWFQWRFNKELLFSHNASRILQRNQTETVYWSLFLNIETSLIPTFWKFSNYVFWFSRHLQF